MIVMGIFYWQQEMRKISRVTMMESVPYC